MRRPVRSGAVSFDVGLFRDLDEDEHAALHAAAERYGDFLELDPTVVAARAARRS